MTGVHDDLIDLVENSRGEKTQVVLDRLQMIRGFVSPASMTGHLPKGVVMVGQFMNAVVIGVEPQAQDSENQNLPLLHPGSPKLRVRFLKPLLLSEAFACPGRDDLLQNLEYGRTYFRSRVNVLQPA